MAGATTTVDADHSQFLITGVNSAGIDAQGDTAKLLVSFEDDVLSVVTGAQWGLVEVTGEHLEGPPPIDEVWEDVVEISLRCTNGLGVAPLFDTAVLIWVEHGGEFRLRVSAQGRDTGSARDYDELDDPEPVERYLLQTWPEAFSDAVIHRLRSTVAQTWGQPPEPPAHLIEQDAGKGASFAIAADIQTRRAELARNQTGAVEVVATLTGTRRKLFPVLTRFCGLWGSSYGWSALGFDLAPGEVLYVDNHRPDEEDGDPITGHDGGYILLTYREIDSPGNASVAWNWYAPSPGQARAFRGQATPVLTSDTVVTLTLTQSKTNDGTARTAIRIKHDGLPPAWTEHMTAWWTWRLARTEQLGVGLR